MNHFSALCRARNYREYREYDRQSRQLSERAQADQEVIAADLQVDLPADHLQEAHHTIDAQRRHRRSPTPHHIDTITTTQDCNAASKQ